MRLQNKVAVITGAGMGQGRAGALIFAKEGAKIVALEIDEKAGKETVELIKQQGGQGTFVKCDVALEKEAKKAIEIGVAAFGKLNILYNNAGVLWADKDLKVTEITEDNWDRIMGINLKGPLWVCKYGIPELIKQGGGSIINIGSFGAYRCSAIRLSAYNASKAALTTLTRSIAMQYADKKVRANVIHPGMVDTPMQSYRTDKEAITEKIPLGRWAQPEEIASCALFLASDESSYITGAEFFVDGGIMGKF